MLFVTEVLLRFRFLRQGLVAKYCMRPWSVTPVSSRLSVWSCGKPASNHTPFQPHAHCQPWLPPTHSISATCTLPALASSYTFHFSHMCAANPGFLLHTPFQPHAHCQNCLPPTHTPFQPYAHYQPWVFPDTHSFPTFPLGGNAYHVFTNSNNKGNVYSTHLQHKVGAQGTLQ